MPSPSRDAVIPIQSLRKSGWRSGVRIRKRRSRNVRPSRWSLIASAGLEGGSQGGAQEVARGDRLTCRCERGTLGQRLLQVVERDAQAAAQPLDAAVHGLVHAARVLEERARAFARAEQREREIEPHGDPTTVATERLAERRHRVLVAAEPQLAPPDELPQVLLRLVAATALVDDLLAQPVGLAGLAHAPQHVR